MAVEGVVVEEAAEPLAGAQDKVNSYHFKTQPEERMHRPEQNNTPNQKTPTKPSSEDLKNHDFSHRKPGFWIVTRTFRIVIQGLLLPMLVVATVASIWFYNQLRQQVHEQSELQGKLARQERLNEWNATLREIQENRKAGQRSEALQLITTAAALRSGLDNEHILQLRQEALETLITPDIRLCTEFPEAEFLHVNPDGTSLVSGGQWAKVRKIPSVEELY